MGRRHRLEGDLEENHLKAAELLDQLRRVGELQFIAKSEGPAGWNGAGAGVVVVESPSPESLIFRESGRWRPVGQGELRFHNVYRWSVAGDQALRLEHLRFGLERPVFLVELAPESEAAWSSVDPHQCRDDCYSARLQLLDAGLLLWWAIVGPRKREDVEYVDRWRTDA